MKSRRLHRWLLPLTLTLALLATGCSDDALVDPAQQALLPDSPGTLTIHLQNSVQTRSTESDNSENLIDNLLVCLYPDDGKTTDETPATVVHSFKGINKHDQHTVTMQLTDEMVNTLFDGTGGVGTDGAQCIIFALANIPANELSKLATAAEKPKMKDMKALAISSPGFKTQQLQSSFVMISDGTDKVAYTAPDKSKGETLGKASNTGNPCKLYRAAAKIKLRIKLPPNITVKDKEGNDVTYVPVVKEGIQALINNGVKNAIAAPVTTTETTTDSDGTETTTTTYWKPAADDAYYDIKFSNTESVRKLSQTGTENVPVTDEYGNPVKDDNGNEITYTICEMDVPFYSYPNAWEETLEETHKTTLTLLVPWQKEGESKWDYYYYQVPVTKDTYIERNHAYTITLTVGMLGSLSPDEPVEVGELSYVVVDWGDAEVDVSLNDYRYLVVNPNDVVFYNEKTMLIPFYSSHPTKITDITMTFQRFNFYYNVETTGPPPNGAPGPEGGSKPTYSTKIVDGNGTLAEITVPKKVIDASNKDSEDEKAENLCYYKPWQDPNTKQWYIKIIHPLEIWTPYETETDTVSLQLALKEGASQDAFNNYIDRITKFKKLTPVDTPYSKYVFTIDIEHEDNSAYSEKVTVTQYPGMYIEADKNPGKGTKGNKGNVYVNSAYKNGYNTNTQKNTDNTYDYYLGSISEGLTGTNTNPNMYVITITNLDASDAYKNYIIGDPRCAYRENTLSVDNDGALTTPKDDTGAAALQRPATDNSYITKTNWCAAATALYKKDETRTLTYYYPTQEDDFYENFVAPKLRVASSYGVTQPTTRTGARRRIATYQEDAYPAGRWRLPTLGEFKFITTLSAQKKIPTLFDTDKNYLTAQGIYQVSVNNNVVSYTKQTNSNSTYVRGVYDEWYWSNSGSYEKLTPSGTDYTYTFGDVPRSVVGN